MPRKRASPDWIILGGKVTEQAYCRRCGEGLALQFPLRMEVFSGALDGFLKAHRDCKDTGRVEPEPTTPEEWIESRDVGVSSATMWAFFTGKPSPYDRADTPKDPADFGRCHRLLQRFPEWRARLPELAEAQPMWAPFVWAWDRMTALYEREEPTGVCRELYDLMKQDIPYLYGVHRTREAQR